MNAPSQPLCGRCGAPGPFGWSLPGGGFIRACGAHRDDAEAAYTARIASRADRLVFNNGVQKRRYVAVHEALAAGKETR